MSILDQMRVLLREQRERAEDRKAAIKPDPPHVTIPAYIPAQLRALSWLATAGVFYMLWLFSLSAAKDAAGALHITHAGTWVGNLLFFFPVIIAFICISAVVAWTGKVAVPAFVSLRWQGDELWPKAWMLVIMVAVSAVIIAGSITVQTETRFEGNREAAVAVEQVGRGRAALEAQKASAEAELSAALSNTNAYLNQAANVGAAEWERSYIAQARATGDPRLPQIERAIGAARRADELRGEIRRLTVEVAQAPTDASVQQRVTTSNVDQAMGGVVDWIGAVRAIMLAVLQDIACLLLPWIALRTEQARNRQLGADSGWADEGHRIEDLRAEDPLPVQPMKGPREVVRDAETGEELIKIVTKPHWRKKKGKPQRIEPDVMAMADETGVPDGGARAGSVERAGSEDGAPVIEAARQDSVISAASVPASGFIASVDGGEEAGDGPDHGGDDGVPGQPQEFAQPSGHDSDLHEYSDEERLALFDEYPITEPTADTIEQHSAEEPQSEPASENVPAFPALTYERAVAADDEEPDAHVRAHPELESAK